MGSINAESSFIEDFLQDQARQDTLDWLNDQTIMVINDWA